MISINATLFLQIIHFLILVFILNRLMFRPLLRIINERNRHIEDENRQLDHLEEETQELVQKSISLERNARREASEESSKLRKEANEVSEKIFSETREKIASIRDEADREINEKIKEARQSLHKEALILAEELMEKLIGRRVAN